MIDFSEMEKAAVITGQIAQFLEDDINLNLDDCKVGVRGETVYVSRLGSQFKIVVLPAVMPKQNEIAVKKSPDGMHESCAVDCKVGPLHFYLSADEAGDLAKKLLNVLGDTEV